jgi:hypothetical protein
MGLSHRLPRWFGGYLEESFMHLCDDFWGWLLGWLDVTWKNYYGGLVASLEGSFMHLLDGFWAA